MKKWLYLLIVLTGLVSCKKQGCTDSTATNYNSSAKKDNGSCNYLLTDVDGNSYHAKAIGNQVWMTENLKVKKYRNGDIIPQVQDNLEWGQLTTGAWCYYENDTFKGILYNWFAVNDPRGLAPSGYHVPQDAEWTTLENFLGIDAGKKMKSTNGWVGLDNGSNTSGFNGLPNGCRNYDGTFSGIDIVGYWWSSTERITSNACYRGLSYFNDIVNGYNGAKKQVGFSVRCLRD